MGHRMEFYTDAATAVEIIDISKSFGVRGKRLHTRNHTKVKSPLKHATENPLDTSSKNPLDKWQSFGKYRWKVKLCWKMPLRIHDAF